MDCVICILVTLKMEVYLDCEYNDTYLFPSALTEGLYKCDLRTHLQQW